MASVELLLPHPDGSGDKYLEEILGALLLYLPKQRPYSIEEDVNEVIDHDKGEICTSKSKNGNIDWYIVTWNFEISLPCKLK